MTKLEELQAIIDRCNNYCGCDSKCCCERQHDCPKLVAHREYMHYCREQGWPIELW